MSEESIFFLMGEELCPLGIFLVLQGLSFRNCQMPRMCKYVLYTIESPWNNLNSTLNWHAQRVRQSQELKVLGPGSMWLTSYVFLTSLDLIGDSDNFFVWYYQF